MQSTKPNGNGPGMFVLEMDAIRQRAREHMKDGAVMPDRETNRATILRILDTALATELVCVMRYKRHHFMSANLGGIAGHAITAELATHAAEEQAHADAIAERIVQLGGEPNFDPKTLSSRSHAEYVAGTTLNEMLEEDLVAERIAIQVYRESIRWIGEQDVTTRRLLEDILKQEEEHADELADFLRRLRVDKRD